MRTSNLVKVDILLNATIVDALSLIHVDNAYHIGKKNV
jgi:GTP-binding protein LepA